ncbi:MAG TPA: serine/threonine-protein kinase [Polyangiaceae bacterium]
MLDERYKIHGYLSRGATSRVYLAEDVDSGAPVVLKMLSPEAARDPELRARIAVEARAGVLVRHPNVVDVLGVGETPGGLPYLVMEALPGEPLDEVLRKTPLLPADLALVLARQAAAGLAATHDAGVIHRDVKPSNLLVLGAPDQPYGLKLLDYGMAKLWDMGPSSETHTVVGTVEYMAPEQIVVEDVNARSDVYALGVVLFRLFTGHLPFETSVGPMVLRHQLFSPIPPPSWLDDAIDSRLEAVILNATRKHPENRYGSMRDLLDDLDAIVGLSNKEVVVHDLRRTPDVYEPTTERGREALEVLARKFGKYASIPPPASA